MPTYYMDYVNGADASDGLTWGTAKQTINGINALVLAAGDTIKIAKSPVPTSLGNTASWTVNSHDVILTSPVTLNIDMCESGWVGGVGVTLTQESTRIKEGIYSLKMVTGAGVTGAQLLAYKTITGTDFSQYQQVSFWLYTSGAIAAGLLQVRLCSDTLGATPVDTLNIPVITSTTAYWIPLTIDNGGALGSSIQSIAIYSTGSFASKTTYWDDFIACKDDSDDASLSLQSLIGKNTGDLEWFPIKCINGSTVTLATGGKGYWANASATVTTWKRETIKTAIPATYAVVQAITDSGSLVGGNITYEGGCNTVSSVVDGETWFDGLTQGGGNSSYIGLNTNASYNTVNNLNFIRYYTGIQAYFNAGNIFSNISCIGNYYYGLFPAFTSGSAPTWSFNNMNCNYIGLNLSGTVLNGTAISVKNANNNTGYGVQIGTGAYNLFSGNMNTCSNSSHGFYTVNYPTQITFLNCVHVSNNNMGSGIYLQQTRRIASYGTCSLTCAYNDGSGIYSGGFQNDINFGDTILNNNSSHGISLNTDPAYGSADWTFKSLYCNNNTGYGIANTYGLSTITAYSGNTSGNTTGGIYLTYGQMYFGNFDIGEVTEVAGWISYSDGRVFCGRPDMALGVHKQYVNGGLIVSDTSVTHGDSVISWRISPTSLLRDIYWPVELSIAKIAVNEDSPVTVTAWFRRDDTNATANLICKSGQLAGITVDATDTMTAGAGNWEQLSITFTPTAKGVVEILAQAYGGTIYNVWVDDMGVSQ